MLKTHTQKNYEKICKILGEANLLMKTARFLEWDQETHMPKNGLSFKAKQSQLLETMAHKLKTSKTYLRLLDTLEKETLPENDKINLRLMKKDYLKESKLPASFLKKYTEATIHSSEAWKEAKTKNHFKTFLPHLRKVIDLNKKKADLLGYKDSPYDALLDLYEPEMTSKEIDAIFNPLKSVTIKLLKKIQEKQKNGKTNPLKGKHFPKESQVALCKEVLKDMGLPFDDYNLAESAHPFCSSQFPHDIRLTTHYYENDFLKSFTGTVHEGGHALYENGLPLEPLGTPLTEACSSGVHESQSRFWETCIALSLPFWKHTFPKVQKYFPKAFEGVSLETFHRSMIHVEPSLIRIFADPVTYNLHIILRTEIEKGFITGTLDPKDLPDIWRSKMHDSFGIVPPSDAEGCLQDIHWSLGYFGYFPTYSLGNLYAGALFIDLIKSHPSWESLIASGQFSFINTYMRDKIHRHGRKFPPLELIQNATATKGPAPWDALIAAHEKRLSLLYL